MAGFDFEVASKNVDETHPKETEKREVPAFLARKKAIAFIAEIEESDAVIGADTVVLLNDVIYEKPKDQQHAIAMLGELSGKMHEVITGVCILTKQREVVFSETTKVSFQHSGIRSLEFT